MSFETAWHLKLIHSFSEKYYLISGISPNLTDYTTIWFIYSDFFEFLKIKIRTEKLKTLIC